MLIAVILFTTHWGSCCTKNVVLDCQQHSRKQYRPPVMIDEKFGWQNRSLRCAARHEMQGDATYVCLENEVCFENEGDCMGK